MIFKRPNRLPAEQSLRLFHPAMLARERRGENEALIRGLCANAYLGRDTALCRVLGRYKMYVDTNDNGLSVHLLIDGYWEMWLTEVIAKTVKPGMTVIDVGANLGYFSVLMAELVGRSGQVHAFEPNAALADRLTRTRQANGFDGILKIHQTVLGETEGARVRFIVPDGDPKNAHVVAAEPEAPDDGMLVSTRRLDRFTELLDADVVKIDADTAEQAIWRGMRGIFDRRRPLTVFLEYNGARYEDPRGFLQEIDAEGFALARVDLSQGVVPCGVDDILADRSGEDQMLMMCR